MPSSNLSRRQLVFVQAALALVAVLSLLAFSGSFSPSHSLASLAPYAGSPQVSLDLSGFATTDGIQAVTAAQAGDMQISLDAFNALNARAGGTLEASWDATTCIPRFLSGNSKSARIPYTPTSAEKGNALATARGFLD